MAFTIRPADDDDMPSITTIYAHAVMHGTASFEIEPPDLSEMIRRRAALVEAGFPYLAAIADDGAIAGYVYAGPYRPRAAYCFTVEDTVYVAPGFQRMGVGRLLLSALIETCTAKGFRAMIAVIGDSASSGSIGLHAAMGFSRVGLLPSIGFKHGRWRDVVLMHRALGPGDTMLPAGTSSD